MEQITGRPLSAEPFLAYLRDKLASVTSELDKLGRQGAPPSQDGATGRGGGATGGAQRSPGDSGQVGEGQQGGGGGRGADMARLREEFQRQLKQTQELVDRTRREDPAGATVARGA